MATGRTISASFLTKLDDKVIQLCESISDSIHEAISDKDNQRDFRNQYGKVHKSRDGGTGVGAGKLQRDAVCTRGRQGKAPFSNRNLRWHPLVVASQKPPFAREIERIEIEGTGNTQVLNFVVKKGKNSEVKFPSDKVHEMTERFVVLPKHWMPHVETLKQWQDVNWTQNSCIISALEACNWWESVETYAVLGIATAVEFYGADFATLHSKVTQLLQGQSIDKKISLPTDEFQTDESSILQCPLCLRNISEGLEDFRKSVPDETWQPAWRTSKQKEGYDSSIQVMHVNPLIESEMRHRVDNVRYGHRWCNESMTNHSLSETLDFMEYVVHAHKWGE